MSLGPQPVGTWYENRKYSLKVIQHPVRARQSGFGDKDRRPLAPALVVQLTVCDADETEIPPDEIVPHFFVATADLYLRDGIQEASMVLHPMHGGSATTSTMRNGLDFTGESILGGPFEARLLSNPRVPVNSPPPRHPKAIQFESYPPPNYTDSPMEFPPPSRSFQQPPTLPSIHTLDHYSGLGQAPPQTNVQYMNQDAMVQSSSAGPSISRYSNLGGSGMQGTRPSSLHINTNASPPRQRTHAGQPTQYAFAGDSSFPNNNNSSTSMQPYNQRNVHQGSASNQREPPYHWAPLQTQGPLSAHPTTVGYSPLEPDRTAKFVRTLVGPAASNAVHLYDENDMLGIFFIFQDLSVRVEGIFRLRVRLWTIERPGSRRSLNTRSPSPMLALAWSEPFEVYSAKRFPGVPEITPLSAAFSAQGQKLPARARRQDEGGPHNAPSSEHLSSEWPDAFPTYDAYQTH